MKYIYQETKFQKKKKKKGVLLNLPFVITNTPSVPLFWSCLKSQIF